jgi:hypothetical protein
VGEFATTEWGEELFDEAAELFFVNWTPPNDGTGMEVWEQLFLPWFVFDFVPQPRRRWRRRAAPDSPSTILALEYARRHGDSLSPAEARFLRAASDAPLSFMAVTGVELGRSLELKDILTGEAHRVIERSATAGLAPGQIALTAGSIRASVNSVKRARKIRGLIEKRLGRDVLYLRQTIESAEALVDPSRRDAPAGLAEPAAPAVGSTPEGRAYLDELNRRHWQAWLDQTVPALGNLTPRAAAKKPLGRERLEALLTEYAWRQSASPDNAIHFDEKWTRTELGLASLD